MAPRWRVRLCCSSLISQRGLDTIHHGILFGHLVDLGVGSVVQQWVHSFLTVSRRWCWSSRPWLLTYGVPQGSAISPMLFNIYMKLLGEVTRELGLLCHQYEDDMQLYLQLPSNHRAAVKALGCGLASVRDWMKVNKLRLNPNKREVRVVGPDLALGNS